MHKNDEKIEELSRALAQAMDDTWLRTHEWDFPEIVREYRQVEAEFVQRTGDDKPLFILETRRRVAEALLSHAHSKEEPHEVCREVWNDLVNLGFTDSERQRMMSWFYADCCLWNKQYDAGLAVIEPVIADYEQWLQNATLRPKSREYHEKDLANDKFLRDGLIALRMGGAEAEAWYERYNARGPTPEQERHSDLSSKLFWARKAISDSAPELNFAEIERRNRQLETEFLASLLPDDEAMVLETKRLIAGDILHQAQEHKQSFEVCRQLWKETHALGFERPEHEAGATRSYAEYCLRHGQADEGLAAVEPILASWQKQIEEDTAEDMTIDYKEEIERMQKLRDELLALKTAGT